jgi:RHS repeat-associated protein
MSAYERPYTEKGGNQAGAIDRSHTFANTRAGSIAEPEISFYRNRYYDQGTGQWMQEDPIGIAGGANLYAYSGNNPVTFTDPFGLDTLSDKERTDLGKLCRQADCSKIHVYRGNDGRGANALRSAVLKTSGGRSVTLGNNIYLSDRDANSRSALAHEATHAWQYQLLGGSEWLRRAVNDRVWEATGGNPYEYRLNGRPFSQYNTDGLEQQAQIVEDCVSGKRGACWAAGFPGAGGP